MHNLLRYSLDCTPCSSIGACDASADLQTLTIPPGYKTPPFPSLYGPSFISTQNGQGIFLYEAQGECPLRVSAINLLTCPVAIWEFTLYWTIILICGTFLLCSVYASCNLLLSLTVFRRSSIAARRESTASRIKRIPTPALSLVRSNEGRDDPADAVPELNHTQNGHGPDVQPRAGNVHSSTRSVPLSAKRIARTPPKRPPLWPVFLLPVVACLVAAVISLISATVIGFALAAVYSAGAFSMST